MTSLQTRLDMIDKLEESGKLTSAAAAKARLEVLVRGDTGEAKTAPSDTVVTTEDTAAKAQKAVQKEVAALIGSYDAIALSSRFLNFVKNSETFARWVHHRLLELTKKDGVEDTSPGRIVWAAIDGATADTPLKGFDGNEPGQKVGRWYVWRFLCNLVAVYTIFYNEQTASKAYTQEKRLKLEEDYMERLLNPLASGSEGVTTAQKMAQGLKSSDTANKTLANTLKREKIADDNEQSSSEDEANHPAKKKKGATAKKITFAKQDESDDLNIHGIPKAFASWSNVRQLAWVKARGKCRLCAEKGQMVHGLESDHDKDDHQKKWQKKADKPGTQKAKQ